MSGGNGGGYGGARGFTSPYSGGPNMGFTDGPKMYPPAGAGGGVKQQPGFGYAGNTGGGMTTGGLDPMAVQQPMAPPYTGSSGLPSGWASGTVPKETGGIKPAPGQMMVGGGPGQPYLMGPSSPFGAGNPAPGTQEWFQSPNGIAQAGAANDRARQAMNPLVSGAMGAMGARMRANPDLQKSQDYFNREMAAMNQPASSYAGQAAAGIPAYNGPGAFNPNDPWANYSQADLQKSLDAYQTPGYLGQYGGANPMVQQALQQQIEAMKRKLGQ